MAEKSRIKVAVVEGDYTELCGLGLPLPLSVQLQCLNQSLSMALWLANASGSASTGRLQLTLKPLRLLLQRRQKRSISVNVGVSEPLAVHPTMKTPEAVPCKVTPSNSPINEHHSPDNIVVPALPSYSVARGGHRGPLAPPPPLFPRMNLF